MTREQIIAEILKHRADLEAMGVKHLSLFGSAARGDMRLDSDVDLFCELSKPMGYFELFDIETELRKWIRHKIDFRTKDALHPWIKQDILRDATQIF